MTWYLKTFSELSLDELYDSMKLRVDVFVVEQACFYPELDNKDRAPSSLHLFSYQKNELNQKQMTTYLRILPKGVEYDEYTAIGRVIVANNLRNTGLGHKLVSQAISICEQHWPDVPIKISAQQHLEKFYQQHGFITSSAMYLEDDIPHIAMIKPVTETTLN